MPQIDRNRRKPATAAVLVMALVALILAGCGGSSSSSSTSASTTKPSSGAQGRFGARSAALRSCLQKNGVTLPERKPGQRGRPFAGAGASGGTQLPNGLTRAQLQAALKKCGAGNFLRAGRGYDRAGAKQRYAKFSACMSKQGVKLPAPNTSGNGPIFNTKGIDTNSAAFKTADAKCQHELLPAGAAAGRPPAGVPGGAPGGAPEGGGPAGPAPGQ